MGPAEIPDFIRIIGGKNAGILHKLRISRINYHENYLRFSHAPLSSGPYISVWFFYTTSTLTEIISSIFFLSLTGRRGAVSHR